MVAAGLKGGLECHVLREPVCHLLLTQPSADCILVQLLVSRDLMLLHPKNHTACQLTDFHLDQPLLSQQPGRYQIFLTPIQKADSDGFSLWECSNMIAFSNVSLYGDAGM